MEFLLRYLQTTGDEAVQATAVRLRRGGRNLAFTAISFVHAWGMDSHASIIIVSDSDVPAGGDPMRARNGEGEPYCSIRRRFLSSIFDGS